MANALFGNMLSTGSKVIRESSPQVTLHVEPEHQFSRELRDQLDYTERDDQLVGIVHRFAKENPGEDVRLLTRDTIPLYRAKGLQLTAERIEETWLLPPENDEKQKQIASLKDEIAELKRSEPSFRLQFRGASDSKADRLNAQYKRYDALTDAEVKKLLAQLCQRFPMATDFGQRTTSRSASSTTTVLEALTRGLATPPTTEKIAKYRENDYPEWLECCEGMLSDLHKLLQRHLEFCFLVENCGIRPAADALITIEAHGNFQVMARRDSENNEQIALPLPPKVPRGALHDFALGLRKMGEPVAHNFPQIGVRSLAPPMHDPNAFYYKPERYSTPQNSFSLCCDQWRHSSGFEAFEGEIHVTGDYGAVEGALELRIEAENLSEPHKKFIPVRIRTVHVSCLHFASALVRDLKET